MCAASIGIAFRFLGYRLLSLPPPIVNARSLLQSSRFQRLRLMESHQNPAGNPTFVTSAHPNRSRGRGRRSDTNDNRQRSTGNCSSSLGNDKFDDLGTLLFQGLRVTESRQNPAGNPTFVTSAHPNRSGRGRGRRSDTNDNRQRSRGNCSSSSGNDKIDALGRLLTRILRHKASELNLDMRSDGYVKVQDLLKLNMKTFANIPLQSHTIEDIREAVRHDNKQRFSLVEENGELLLRANQGHTLTTVETESLLKPILSAEEVPVCVHGTYKRNLDSILREGLKRMQRLHVHFCSGLPRDAEVVSGMRRDVDTIIFLDVRKALEEGMKLYVSDNKVILTEGFDGVVPVKYFQKIESWPQRQPIPF